MHQGYLDTGYHGAGLVGNQTGKTATYDCLA